MLRSFFTAISGLKAHNTRIDVISNNIANANTVGYKSAKATFRDVLYLMNRAARAPYAGRGGTNPSQIGLGVQVSNINNIMTQGAIQNTGRITDLAIQGGGFFVLSDGQRYFYTRDGSFDIDTNGALVSAATGLKVQGWSISPTAKVNVHGSIDTSTTTQTLIRVYDEFGQEHVLTVKFDSTTNGVIATIYDGVNASAPVLLSNHIITFDASTNRVIGGQIASLRWHGQNISIDFNNLQSASVTAVFADPDITPDAGKVGDIVIPQDMSMAPTPTSSITFNGNLDAAATASDNITFSVSGIVDSLGREHAMVVTMTPKDGSANTWVATVSIGSKVWKFGVTFTNDGRFESVYYNTSDPAGDPFDPANSATTSEPTIAIDPNDPLLSEFAGANPMDINLTFNSLTQYASQSTVSGSADGVKEGKLESFFITPDGQVVGTFTNGLVKPIARIALASFSNPAGLQREGSNLWSDSANSGFEGFKTADDLGSEVISGALEMSNVDLAEEFTDLIITQRGFQANSRVITTADEITMEILNIKR